MTKELYIERMKQCRLKVELFYAIRLASLDEHLTDEEFSDLNRLYFQLKKIVKE